ncbi:hypothetical protein [Atopococcus tabaci]|uniref:hypothetical protein n=1 Tax=Atopococcus tabaci TaxID=269774 RepID=UPI0003F7E441|nr:hypothetical protein [Atopococcus tabaci]
MHELKKAVDNKWIPEERIDAANKRLLKEMFQLGLFDENTYVDNQASLDALKDTARHEKAYEAHLKSVTLLKNDGTLPLQDKKSTSNRSTKIRKKQTPTHKEP